MTKVKYSQLLLLLSTAGMLKQPACMQSVLARRLEVKHSVTSEHWYAAVCSYQISIMKMASKICCKVCFFPHHIFIGVMFQLEQFLPDSLSPLQWGTADAKVKVPSVENPELTNVLPGVCVSSAMHASPTARNFFFVLILTFPVHLPLFFSNPLSTFYVMGLCNKTGHYAHSCKQCKQVSMASASRI